MADKIIEIPGVGNIAFPDTMSDEQISTAAAKLYQTKQGALGIKAEAKPGLYGMTTDPEVGQQMAAGASDALKGIGRAAVNALPSVGGAVGAVAGGATGGPPGALAGAALGGAAGEGWRQVLHYFTGGSTPSTEAGAVGRMAGQAALQAGAEGVGQGAGALMSKAGPAIMRSAVKAGKPLLDEYRTTAPKLAQTLLDEGINVTQNGILKLQKLVDATNAEIKDALTSRDSLLTRLGISNEVIDKKAVAARALSTAGKVAQQVNPTQDLQTVGDVAKEFVNHPVYTGPKLSLPDAQAMKVGTYQQIGKKYGEISSASVETQKALARGLKEDIASEVPAVANLNKRDSELLVALDAVGRRVAVAGNRDPVGFAWVSHHPVTFIAALMDRSPAVKSLLARGLYQSAASAARVSPQLLRTALAAIAQSDTGEPDAAPPDR